MGRKMRSVLMLLIVLVLIYYQQMPVIYAEEEVKKELSEEADQENKEADQENHVEEDREGDREGDEEGDGEGDREGDGEEGEGGDGDREDVVIEKYQLNYPEADGKEGYYITVPQIEIFHVGEAGTTLYQLWHEGEVLAEGRLTKENPAARLSGSQFAEGINSLAVGMEDEEGVRIEAYDSVTEIKLDTQAPQFDMKASDGFDTWYQKEAWITVQADDAACGSQVASISCYCGNQMIGTTKDAEAKFLVQQASDSANGVNITVTVVDKAGNKSEMTKKLYIDNCAPRMSIEGITDYMITSQPVTVTYQVIEDNGIKECTAETLWEDTEGNRQNIPNEAWQEKGKGRTMTQVLTADGIYQMKGSVSDLASFRDEAAAQIIIDSQNPVIQYVDELEGQYMRQFCWNYPKETFIKDFTTFLYQIQMDGKLYPLGTEITAEGRHVLRVEAIDSAGNKAEAKAAFVIDRTPPKIEFYDVEEGGKYEEKKTFKVTVKNPEDTIEEVKINGVSQELGGDKNAYQFTVEGEDIYETVVKAQDRAGNQTVEELLFEIIPRETTFQKMVKPVKRILGGSKTKESETAPKSKSGYLGWVVIGVLAAGGIIGGCCWRKMSKSKEEEMN